MRNLQYTIYKVPRWNIWGKAFFILMQSFQIAGYGRVAPLSEAGKGFCLLYAMIGIPLTLIFFTAIVERMMIPTKMFLYFLFRKLGHLYRVFHIQLLHFFILLIATVLIIFVVPAAIYSALEPKWDFLDSFYYCFISMTTIGLGDYIPGDNPDQKARAVYKLATTGRYPVHIRQKRGIEALRHNSNIIMNMYMYIDANLFN